MRKLPRLRLSLQRFSSCSERVRAGLVDKEFRKLMGIVEIDETFIGGNAPQSAPEQFGQNLPHDLSNVSPQPAHVSRRDLGLR